VVDWPGVPFAKPTCGPFVVIVGKVVGPPAVFQLVSTMKLGNSLPIFEAITRKDEEGWTGWWDNVLHYAAERSLDTLLQL
jgi:hypothetical protein